MKLSEVVGDPIDRALELEQLDVDLYRSVRLWRPVNGRGAFGGQVIGQATWAATQSVEPSFSLHSLHSYFLSFGDCTQAIIYAVDRLRDGRSYATRTVKALQRGKCIFTMTASFQVPEPGQPIRYLALPRPPSGEAAFPEPDRCQPTEERIAAFLAENAAVIPTKVRVFLETLQDERRQSRIEIRSALPDDFGDFWRGNQTSDQQAFWIRSRPGDELRSDDAFRRCVLAFISDYHLIGTSSKALGLNTRGGRRLAMMASLDHSLHFYEPIDPQNWMLYHMTFQAASNGRAVVHGAIYSHDGRLAALATQEGVCRAQPEREAKL